MLKRGLVYGVAAYALWGVLPVYWKTIHHVPAMEIISHRMVWSLVLVLGLMVLKKEWSWVRRVARRPWIALVTLTAAVLLAANWLTYVWAVNAGFVVETSLGYFINPLVNVVLGVVFLRERLRPWQWVSVGLAGAGVLYLTLSYNALPWIALTLAFTFGLYGLLKKTASFNALEGLTLEMGFLLVPALGYLVYLEWVGQGVFGHTDPLTTLLLILTGAITVTPLLLFAGAARRIDLSTLGILQYLAPTLQLLLGVFLYGEPFPYTRFIGFCFIWTALGIYTVEGLMTRRRAMAARTGQPAVRPVDG